VAVIDGRSGAYLWSLFGALPESRAGEAFSGLRDPFAPLASIWGAGYGVAGALGEELILLAW
jgi:hypothetical protein